MAEQNGDDPAQPTTTPSPKGKSEGGKARLGADTSQQSLDAGKPVKKAGDMFGSTNKLQRDLSVKTIQSKATADTMTMEGSLMGGPFKFGV